jgi:ferredoxin
VDLLRLPLVGAVLRWRHLRASLQLVLLGASALVVLHGLLGPQIAPRNLATVLTSIHWRGFLVIGLLVAGNVFCTACPMVLARDAGRRFVRPRLSWPAGLRRKWVAIGLLIAVLFSYELFDLWEQPRATAWLILGYFGLALVVDLLFKGASFCKHLCPIGQFNFVASTLSPTTVQVRDAGTCRSCRTSDCIKGRAPVEPLRTGRRGCELGLFLPGKVGNLDCTLCLDCVHACPHDNVAVVTRIPALELLDARRRSGVGRLRDRADLGVLAAVFTFAALLNAFAMTAPALAFERTVGALLHVSSEAVVLALLFVLFLIVGPVALLFGAAALTRASGGGAAVPLRSIALGYAFTLVPLGLGVWAAHYGFHLFTGVLTVVPVTQSAAADLWGWPALGEPAWGWTGMRAGAVYPIQLGFVLLGACGSMAVARGMADRTRVEGPALPAAPWLAAIAVLTAAALWILQQPMEMRGLGGIG